MVDADVGGSEQITSPYSGCSGTILTLVGLLNFCVASFPESEIGVYKGRRDVRVLVVGSGGFGTLRAEGTPMLLLCWV